MIPSRGIARSLPSVGLRRHISTRSAIQPIALRTVNGGRLGASLRTTGGLSAGSLLRPAYAAAPIALGGVQTSRAFSLWGSAKPAAPPAAAPETAPEAVPVQEAAAPAEVVAATQTPAPVEPSPAASDITSVPTTEFDLSSIEQAMNTPDILNMPEQIGYLHALGLDYGWGPTSVMQWVLEHVHIYSGMGWAGSIVATAVLLRVIMFTPQVKSQRFNAKMAVMRQDERYMEAQKLVRESLSTGDAQLRQRGQFMNKQLQKDYNVSMWGMLWAFGQIPFSFGLFRAVTGMAQLPVPGLEATSFLWINNLTQTDPYLIMPAIGTGLIAMSMMVTMKQTPGSQQKMMKNIAIGIGAIGFVVTCFMSAAINIMAAALAGSTLVTSLILNSTFVRAKLQLPQLPSQPQPTTPVYSAPRKSAPGIKGMTDRLSKDLKDVRKGFSEKMSSMTGQVNESATDRAARKRKEMIKKIEADRRQQEIDEFERKYKRKN